MSKKDAGKESKRDARRESKRDARKESNRDAREKSKRDAKWMAAQKSRNENYPEWKHINEMYERIAQSKAGLITTGALAVICLACFFLFGPMVVVVIAIGAFLISGIGFILVGVDFRGSAVHNFFGSVCVLILVLLSLGAFMAQFFIGGE
ncbi:hypothetical protein N8639_00215 [bacterium]|nr:hypothetical protein [bacterium]